MTRGLHGSRAHVWYALAAWLAVLLLSAAPSRAGTEQFSTFDVRIQEEDDESLLDHLLTRAPRAWRYEWEHSPSAIRTSQGCLTSGQWFIDTELKLRTELGTHAQFGLDVRQNQTDRVAFDYVDFSFRFPTQIGTFGVMFRPLYDKSRQDFGFTWETGSDTSAFQLQTAFILEDTFNNLWEFRQSRVGEGSEPYEKHPYEPNLRIVHRAPGGPIERIEVGGTWLTHSIKRITSSSTPYDHGMWGSFGYGLIELNALGLGWEARGHNLQATSSDQPLDFSTGDGQDFRRQWMAEVGVHGSLGRGVELEARYLYQARTQTHREPLGPSTFDAIDRVISLETRFPIKGVWSGRVGGMFDRITVDQSITNPAFSYGTRNESRAFVGLSARFGRVSVHAVEGIELDPEPYEVWLVHDKGFLHLQATF